MAVPLIESTTVALVSLALDGSTLRHQAIAHNIANANTPGFRPVAVSFEDKLAEAREALSRDPEHALAAMDGFRPTMELLPPNALGDSSVALDMEVAKLSENTMQHEALLKALTRHFSILKTAINEGKS